MNRVAGAAAGDPRKVFLLQTTAACFESQSDPSAASLAAMDRFLDDIACHTLTVTSTSDAQV